MVVMGFSTTLSPTTKCVAVASRVQSSMPAPKISFVPGSRALNLKRVVSVHAKKEGKTTEAEVVPDAPPSKGSAAEDDPNRAFFLGVKGNAQMLGIRGAAVETDIWKIRLQLTKPVTWIPLIWGVICGAAASGNFEWTFRDCALSALCMLMSGPLLTGFTQTMNDYYDREMDAINEPNRPIPSGAIPEGDVVAQIWILFFTSIAVAYTLDQASPSHDNLQLTGLALIGSFISFAYSVPWIKLKRSGWIGNYALGSSYIALPWWAGQILFGQLRLDVAILTMLYSIAGLGIAIVNDFKSIKGDRELGLNSLPVAFGIEKAKWICAASIDVTQLGVAAYLAWGLNEPYYAAGIAACLAPQVYAQVRYFLPDPVANDVKYQATAQPFLVIGLLVTALAIGHQATPVALG
uniref:Chlorophyll synthase, chloroplastic n=1 Tax=Auxenochlorella protothecoides TaxID=3075 RepID=A0A1D2ACQ7_AUXPR